MFPLQEAPGILVQCGELDVYKCNENNPDLKTPTHILSHEQNKENVSSIGPITGHTCQLSGPIREQELHIFTFLKSSKVLTPLSLTMTCAVGPCLGNYLLLEHGPG